MPQKIGFITTSATAGCPGVNRRVEMLAGDKNNFAVISAGRDGLFLTEDDVRPQRRAPGGAGIPPAGRHGPA